jgi:phosphoribosylformylglycinamidine synthase I
MSVQVAMLRAPGTNRDADLARAFEAVGAHVTPVDLHAPRLDLARLADARIVAIPGGFSWGDDLGAGRMFALQMMRRIGDRLREHVAQGRLVLGICNGFQVLLHSGLLTDDLEPTLQPALVPNRDGRFVCRWTTVAPAAEAKAPWIAGLAGQTLRWPVAHAEGRFIAPDAALDALEAGGRVVLRYTDATNPSGSARDIAGLCDHTGQVVGLMPHPENHIEPHQGPDPDWQRADGLPFFRRLVEHAAALGGARGI